ncbi:MAG: hypothetical protein WB868_21985 [Xanthobacteraceae bacterium]
MRHPPRTDIAAGAGNVLDDEILAGLLAELLRDQPADQIGRTARLKADDKLDRPLG